MAEKKTIFDQKTKFFVFLFLMMLFILLGRMLHIDAQFIKGALSGLPLWMSGTFYVLLYVLITFFVWFGPRDIFRFAGAYLFGPFISAAFVWIAEMINAVVQFQVSRWMGKDYIEEKLASKSAALEQARCSAGFFTAFTLRLNPLVPFRFQDLAAGVTRMPLSTYILALAIPTFVRILWLQLFLAGLGEAVFGNIKAVEQYMREHQFVALYTFIYFLAVIITSLMLVSKAFFRKAKVWVRFVRIMRGQL